MTTPTCARCGLAEGNSLGVAVQTYHLRPAGGPRALCRGPVYVARLALCDRCLAEAGLPALAGRRDRTAEVRRRSAA
jgi:hypothetical protein